MANFDFELEADDKDDNDGRSQGGPRGLGQEQPQGSPQFQPPQNNYSPFPSGAQTLGRPMYPWLERWQGPFATPMGQHENRALEGMGNFADTGFGLGDSSQYLSQVMGGQWLNPNNQYFDQIESSGRSLLDREQADGLRRIASSSSAGGNGLSGARLAAEGRYMSDSNDQFNRMMAELRAGQYARERGYMMQAPGMQNDISRTQMGGLDQYMQMGSVPRRISDQEISGQYNDWLRQIGSLENQSRYGDQIAMSFLGNNRYPGYQQPGYGNSTADQLIPLLAMLFGSGGKNGVGGQLGSALGNLLSGLGGGGSNPSGGGGGNNIDGGPPQDYGPDWPDASYDPYTDPNSAYFDDPLFDPNNYANPYDNDPLFDPNNYA